MTLSRVDQWEIVVLIVFSAILLLVIAFAPFGPSYEPWHDPARELPADLSSVDGAYAEMVDGRPMLVRALVVYQDISTERGYDEQWIYDDGLGGAGADLGRPYRWTKDKTAAMPEIPDLLLEAMARK